MESLVYELQTEQEELQRIIKNIKEQLLTCPEGGMKIRKKGKRPEYYRTGSGDKEYYIKKCEIELIRALAQKSYLKDLLNDVSEQEDTIQKFLKKYSNTALADAYQKLSKERRELIEPLYITDEDFAKDWQNTSYTGKGFALNDAEIITERGERVRSKSEKIIADKLFLLNIPYRYEYPLYLKPIGTIYPDFTILDKRKRKEIVLEHFGMIDNPDYAINALQKMELYQKNGYVPGKNLIFTFESSRKPFDVRNLEISLKELMGTML